MRPDPQLVERFVRDLNALIDPNARIGIAVSGGPDSFALLLLAAAARRGKLEAATVDHRLRPESRGEAEAVGAACEQLGVPHRVLTAEWAEKPATGVQERARTERYRLLGQWAAERALGALAMAHHLDDQAETFLMRLSRGAGVRGLGGMRALATTPGSGLPLLRPLLGWRRTELERLCKEAGAPTVHDPSNEDSRFERVRARQTLARLDCLDAEAIAASAAHLSAADAALEWATDQVWANAVTRRGEQLLYRPAGTPQEIQRRIVSRIIGQLAHEGHGALRGRELDRLLEVLDNGGRATLRGVAASGGDDWRFVRAPNRGT